MTTNREFAELNKVFQLACTLADVKATKRQAAKWRQHRGRAFLQRHAAVHQAAPTTTPEEMREACS